MRIIGFQAVHVRVPLEAPYVIARGRMEAFDSVIVRVETDDGLRGYGESVPLSVVGDPVRLAALLNGPIARTCIGRDPLDIAPLVTAALAEAGPDGDAVAGLDLALWDLAGKALGQPVYRLLGGCVQERIEATYTIGAQPAAVMAEIARARQREGYRTVVVKVTGHADNDAARVRAVRRTLPNGCRVRVDCNGGYSREEARRFLRGIADLDLEFVEQPVPGEDLEGMRLCRQVGIRISADESLNTPADALALIRAQACDVLNVKVPKVGGLLRSRQIAAIGAAAGLPIVVGGRTSLELSRYASRHYAASTPEAVGHGHEGPGPASQTLVDDVVVRRTVRATVSETGGFVAVEHAPGLGADVRWDKVERYAVEEAGPYDGTG